MLFRSSDDVVRITLDAFRNDTEAVVLHGGAAADTTKKTLLNTLLELDNCDARRGGSDLNRNLANGQPRDPDAV